MADYSKPTKIPRWADTGVVVEPSESKKDLGWVAPELPPDTYFNWHQNLVGQWSKWIDERHDDVGTADTYRVHAPDLTGTDVEGGTLNLEAGAATGDGHSILNLKAVTGGQGGGTTVRAPENYLVLEGDIERIRAYKRLYVLNNSSGSGVAISGLARSGSGATGITAVGDGAGNGLLGTGGSGGGSGVYGSGGGSGSGVRGVGGSSNGAGVLGTGNGSGAGVSATGGGSSGAGVSGTGGSTNGIGVIGVGVGTGGGVVGTGGGSSGAGVSGTGGSTNGIGVSAQGTGAGRGVEATGGSSASGGSFTAGGTGSSYYGAEIYGSSGGSRGLLVEPSGTHDGIVVNKAASPGGSVGLDINWTGGGGSGDAISISSDSGGMVLSVSGGEGINLTHTGTQNAMTIGGSGAGTKLFIGTVSTASAFRGIYFEAANWSTSQKAPLSLPAVGQPAGPHVVGDLYVTVAGVLKICTVAGNPGTFVSVGAQT